ncbi:MAG: H-X9-DG-CTERM domain-containing protein, partial [Patescibacteria group bacterium]
MPPAEDIHKIYGFRCHYQAPSINIQIQKGDITSKYLSKTWTPSVFIVMGDSLHSGGLLPFEIMYDLNSGGSYRGLPHARHSNKVNCFFADGHVEGIIGLTLIEGGTSVPGGKYWFSNFIDANN